MTYILAHSVNGVYDVTRRYVKDWGIISDRRSQLQIDMLSHSLMVHNNNLRELLNPEVIEILSERDLIEQMEFLNVKSLQEAEMIGRQSGSIEWKQERGEIKPN
jgi:peptide-N4-(N-acetyl-beta-glucosaminyl)asparagine amidase